MAKRVKGRAKAKENPSIPIIGSITAPPADWTRMVPTIGPVHENETRTRVKAIKKGPPMPPLSTRSSDLLIIQLGRLISNIPKNHAAKNMKIKKKNTIWNPMGVLRKLGYSGPKMMLPRVPMRDVI